MPRYALTIEYDGTPFRGWQRQATGLSVQEALEEAVRAFTGAPAQVVGAGRTDSGVHARGQRAHVDIARDDPPEVIRNALNHHLRPAPIVVIEAQVVDEDFHARFSATGRYYQYLITNRRAPPALEARRTWWVPGYLDTEAMHEAAQYLVGRHDFSSFRSADCQANSPVKTLDTLVVLRENETITIEARAKSFLHHQVRNMVGTLKLIGEDKWPIGAMARVLRARDRRTAGPTAPAEGLYLMDVTY